MTELERKRNRRGEGSLLAQEILAAATALVDESDEPLSLRAVARRARISAPSIYSHFADLGAITDAVLIHSFDELHGTVARAVEEVDDPVDAVVAASLAYVGFAWNHRPRYRFMFAAEGYAPDAVRTFTLLEEATRDCVRHGRSESSDPHLDTWMVWAALHGVSMLEKPARTDLLRLGPLDRPVMLATMVKRLARIPEAQSLPS